MLEKVRQIEMIFREIDNKTASLLNETKVFCPQDCVLCCLKPDLEASVLECLPLAWHIVSAGHHEELLGKIESGEEVCICLNQIKKESARPGCKYYPHRPAICRLFGSASVRDRKTGKQTLYACKTQKENYADEWESIREIVNLHPSLPVVSDFYYRLYAIDPHLANDYNPINQSLYKAVGAVSLYPGQRER